MPPYDDALVRVLDDVVRPDARSVDADGRFPRRGIDALGEAGILGLTVAEPFGGGGGGLADAADVVRRLAEVCGSTAMVVLMHYAATSVLERYGDDDVRQAVGHGRHLTTLAFSEVGSRSHFWAPLSTAALCEGGVRLEARKSWVTAAGEADSYVWSSRPVEADGPMSLWMVPADALGLAAPGRFDGLGLRGNRSAPIDGGGVTVPAQAALGPDGAGLGIAMEVVLPWFLVLSGAFSLGLMEAAVAETGAHLTATRLEHLDARLVDQPLARADHARMRIATDQVAALVDAAVAAIDAGRPEAPLRALEVKAAAGEAAITVTDLAMKLCGGAAFRKELGIERRFRDARAARVMAPTTDALLDFVGRAINGMDLL
ncbi:MAG: acyl-CoA/acyl-ACP dehydrogenase [Actinomycetota bacterium]|nr:acyl-CoA/acyl-ACP dehydrogenase [Actinomycetota bacterium]